MKILYYFRELNTPMYWWQRIHIFNELSETGYATIETVNPLDYESIEEANEKLIRKIKSDPSIDIFLTCVDSVWIYKSTIEEIKKLGIPTILVCWDNLELPFKHKKIANSFDLVWLTSIETKYIFENWGCKNIVFRTYAANPYALNPTWKSPIASVGFIGSPYGSRVNKINDLLDNNITCNVYTDAFYKKNFNTSVGSKKIDVKDMFVKAVRYFKFPIGRKVFYSTAINKLKSQNALKTENGCLNKFPSVSDSEMCQLYSNLTLSLNITELRDTYILKYPIHKIHLRAFEIPMSGGLQLASYTEELASYFEEDKEIVLYRSKEEMIEKCKFYLNSNNESLVLKMKKAARKRAETDHTWQNRFKDVLSQL